MPSKIEILVFELRWPTYKKKWAIEGLELKDHLSRKYSTLHKITFIGTGSFSWDRGAGKLCTLWPSVDMLDTCCKASGLVGDECAHTTDAVSTLLAY